jgi:hypothetical protein
MCYTLFLDQLFGQLHTAQYKHAITPYLSSKSIPFYQVIWSIVETLEEVTEICIGKLNLSKRVFVFLTL